MVAVLCYGTGSLVLINDVADVSSRMNSEVYNFFCSDSTKTDRMVFTVQMDNDAEHPATEDLVKTRK